MIGGTLLSVVLPGLAWLCAQVGAQAAFDGARFVFQGTVLSVSDTTRATQRPAARTESAKLKDLPVAEQPKHWRQVTFRVDALWKGLPRDEVKITSGYDGWFGPGYWILPGDTFVVYADSNEFGYVVDGCSRFHPATQAANDSLGPPLFVRMDGELRPAH